MKPFTHKNEHVWELLYQLGGLWTQYSNSYKINSKCFNMAIMNLNTLAPGYLPSHLLLAVFHAPNHIHTPFSSHTVLLVIFRYNYFFELLDSWVMLFLLTGILYSLFHTRWATAVFQPYWSFTKTSNTLSSFNFGLLNFLFSLLGILLP